MRHLLSSLLLLSLLPASASASIIISGSITQSTADGTGPATNNPSLNNINDGQAFSITLANATPITGPGFYTFTGSPLTFSVPSAPAAESLFSTITLNVASSGSFDDFSLFACLAGFDCSVGNSLSASFRIPAASIGALNVAAIGLDPPHPFELLEDDGITDLHGSISLYSNTSPGTTTPTTTTPEPPSAVLTALPLLGIVLSTLKRKLNPRTT